MLDCTICSYVVLAGYSYFFCLTCCFLVNWICLAEQSHKSEKGTNERCFGYNDSNGNINLCPESRVNEVIVYLLCIHTKEHK